MLGIFLLVLGFLFLHGFTDLVYLVNYSFNVSSMSLNGSVCLVFQYACNINISWATDQIPEHR